MIPAPSRGTFPVARADFQDGADDDDDDDDEGWQDMPVVRSDNFDSLGFEDEDERKDKYRPPVRLDTDDHVVMGNATGAQLQLDPELTTESTWRDKLTQDESDYTRLRLFEDQESEEVHMRTKYLFDEEKAMTPLSQMQATKELLTEGQRIAYVGLCALVARAMLIDMGRGVVHGKGKKKTSAAAGSVENGKIWMLKIMARLYQHMELEVAEQKMIESLAEHGVDPMDLVPSLMTTHTIKNPEYDPEEVKRQQVARELERVRLETESKERERKAEAEGVAVQTSEGQEAPPPPYTKSISDGADATESPATPSRLERHPSPPPLTPRKITNPFGDDDDDDLELAGEQGGPPEQAPVEARARSRSIAQPISPVQDEDDGDIAGFVHDAIVAESAPAAEDVPLPHDEDEPTTPKANASLSLPEKDTDRKFNPLPPEHSPLAESAPLPGVSTSLSKTDENVTLDIRWTILCDLFLVLIADSVYDSRSRVFLERVADRLGLTELDVTRFEKRVTDALEIQEGVEKLEQEDVIEGRRRQGKKKRYAMLGLATLGGGLVIGLSAGLLAPVIGAGLGAALATVGVTGTTGFLAGAGGAAVITTGGVLTGSSIAGKGMARRTREVRTFEFKPIHNNKRVNCFITVPGFMASVVDDVRLPYSVLDPIVGDVFTVLWEPEMMNEMGNALRILTTEVLTQVGQTVLQATVMAALMSALQWPLILTKLGYLIDNPWSNALDRSYAAGLVLADTLMARHAGVRPISLIGFSLGARVIFYALEELARHKAYGIVQDVYLFGATVTASRSTWLEVRSVVAGRFVNGFSTSDWLLGYLFRATSGGLNTVAGLRPVENVPRLENVDVTDKITGHMSYRTCMPVLLETVGLPITADWFDEPDDPELDMSIQERIIITKEEEEARLRREKKIWGVFPRLKSNKSSNGKSTPTLPPSFGGVVGVNKDKSAAHEEYNEDDEEAHHARPSMSSGASTPTHLNVPHPLNGLGGSGGSNTANSSQTSLDIPKTAGFDFAAISRELGKNVDPANGGVIRDVPVGGPVSALSCPPSLDRTGSAPPPTTGTIKAVGADADDGDVGRVSDRPDVGSRRETSLGTFAPPQSSASTPSLALQDDDALSWRRPAIPTRTSTGISSSSSESNSSNTTSIGGRGLNLPSFAISNEWSTPAPAPVLGSSTSSSSFGLGFGGSGTRSYGGNVKMAPPARPFPAEFLSGTTGTGGSSSDRPAYGFGSVEDDDAGDIGGGFGGAAAGTSSSTPAVKRDTKWDEAESNPW